MSNTVKLIGSVAYQGQDKNGRTFHGISPLGGGKQAFVYGLAVGVGEVVEILAIPGSGRNFTAIASRPHVIAEDLWASTPVVTGEQLEAMAAQPVAVPQAQAAQPVQQPKQQAQKPVAVAASSVAAHVDEDGIPW